MNIYCIINYFLFTMTGFMMAYLGLEFLTLCTSKKNWNRIHPPQQYQRNKDNTMTNLMDRMPDNFYPFYCLCTSVIVTYLIMTPPSEFIERAKMMPHNSTREDMHELYMDVCNNGGAYEYNSCNLWWSALLFLTLIYQFIFYFLNKIL